MRLLNADNTVYNLDFVPTEPIRINHCIMDLSEMENIDYFFPLMEDVEEITRAVAVLKIGEYKMKMPLKWHVLTYCDDTFEVQLVEVSELVEFDTSTFVFNPLSGFMPVRGMGIDIINVYKDMKWYSPSMKPKTLVAVPLTDEDGAPCAFFSRDAVKNIENLQYGELWS